MRHGDTVDFSLSVGGGKHLLRQRNRRWFPPTRHDRSHRNHFTPTFHYSVFPPYRGHHCHCSRQHLVAEGISHFVSAASFHDVHDNTLSRKAFHICLRRAYTPFPPRSECNDAKAFHFSPTAHTRCFPPRSQRFRRDLPCTVAEAFHFSPTAPTHRFHSNPTVSAATFHDEIFVADPPCAHADHCWWADSTSTPQLPTIITTCDTDSISTPQRPADHKACSADGTSTHTEPHPADMITHDRVATAATTVDPHRSWGALRVIDLCNMVCEKRGEW